MKQKELVYNRYNLSKKARLNHEEDRLKQEIVDYNNNNLRGKTQHECTVRPMRTATGESTNTIHEGGVFRGYISGLHDHFMPDTDSDSSLEQVMIENDMCPIYNTNSPSDAEPVATNGSTMIMETCNRSGPAPLGNTRNLRGLFGSSPAGGAMTGIGGAQYGGQGLGGFFGGGSGDPTALIPENQVSNRVLGDKFIVNGVVYESVPAEDAAEAAIKLEKSANKSGQRPYVRGEQKAKWDGTNSGRLWVYREIYKPVCEMRPSKYKNPHKSAWYFAEKLATDKESYWSSWFFRRCYKNYWSEDSKTPGMDSSTIYDYTADQGLAMRLKVEADPEKYKDQIMFITFRSTEAPVFRGDAIFNIRKKGVPNSFDMITPKGRQLPAHMKILVGSIMGGPMRAIGGNEGKRSTVNIVEVATEGASSNRMMIGDAVEKWPAVYKRVKCLGVDTGFFN